MSTRVSISTGPQTGTCWSLPYLRPPGENFTKKISFQVRMIKLLNSVPGKWNGDFKKFINKKIRGKFILNDTSLSNYTSTKTGTDISFPVSVFMCLRKPIQTRDTGGWGVVYPRFICCGFSFVDIILRTLPFSPCDPLGLRLKPSGGWREVLVLRTRTKQTPVVRTEREGGPGESSIPSVSRPKWTSEGWLHFCGSHRRLSLPNPKRPVHKIYPFSWCRQRKSLVDLWSNWRLLLDVLRITYLPTYSPTYLPTYLRPLLLPFVFMSRFWWKGNWSTGDPDTTLRLSPGYYCKDE